MSVLIFVQDVHTSLKGLHNNVPTFLLDRIMLEGRCAAAPESCQGCASPYALHTMSLPLSILQFHPLLSPPLPHTPCSPPPRPPAAPPPHHRIMLEGRCAAAPESCQGCASPYAFETALRLLEIEEEIVGARMTRSTSQGVGGRAQHCTRVSGWAGGVTALVWGHA